MAGLRAGMWLGTHNRIVSVSRDVAGDWVLLDSGGTLYTSRWGLEGLRATEHCEPDPAKRPFVPWPEDRYRGINHFLY